MKDSKNANRNVFIPCCMGTAAACGCGKSLDAIRSFCTCCPKVQGQDLYDRVNELELRVKAIEEREKIRNG